MAQDTLYLVRHAKAGERRVWSEDDRERPLSTAGWKQAEAIGKRLADHGARSVLSSPYVRCLQTVEPLGRRIRQDVGLDDRLLEGEPFEGVLDLLAVAAPGTVSCTHGDIVPAVIRALARRGMDVQTPPDWRKATIWVLKRNGERITRGKVWPPPAKRSIA